MDMKTSPLALLNDPTLLKTDALINGQWVAGSQRFDVTDPATGGHLASVANLGAAEAEAAIAAANAAWGPWKTKTAQRQNNMVRQTIVYYYSGAIAIHSKEATNSTPQHPYCPYAICDI
jgi:succinate-semialdehyde dehydrogenase/glutarate-semialdehyde dehydrogenase